MLEQITNLTNGLRSRRAARSVRALKKRLIDIACDEHCVRSVADCGGVWGVDGMYTFHALEHHEIDRAVLVDTHVSDSVRKRSGEFPQLEVVTGNFGDPEVIERVRPVDAVLLYDVLLHQVRPDWDQILASYGGFANSLLIFNQQWTGGDSTVRLLELGRDQYLANVPLTEFHASALEKLDELHPEHGRPWRDVHHIWQWGITDDDLRARAAGLGFEQVFFADAGPFPGLPNFRNRAFVFERRG